MHISIENLWFGFDIGKVVTEFLAGRNPHTLGDEFLDVPPYDMAFESIAAIIDATSPTRTYAVSYCGTLVESMTRRWLAHHGFYARTGFRPEMLGFTQDWTKKAQIALQLTGGKATSFVDDKLVVLEPMIGLIPDLMLYGEQPPGQIVPAQIHPVNNWTSGVLPRYGLTA